MKKIKYGMPTLIELDTLEDNINLCLELGLNFIELNMNLPEYQLENIDLDCVKKIKKYYGIDFTLHLPEEIDIGNFHSNIRKAYCKTLISSIKLADKLGIKLINMHMNEGVHFTLPNKKIYLYDKYKEVYLKNIREFRYELENVLKDKNIILSIENTGILDKSFIEHGTKELLSCNKIQLTYDVGHDYSNGYNDKEFMLKNINRIKHMHLHDAIGKRNHLELYKGNIDLDPMLNLALKNNATCVIETKTKEALINSVSKLKK